MGEPIIKMDSDDKASIISYNVPEPISYSGRNIIELEFDESIFTDAAKAIPENRLTELSYEDLESAVDAATETGVVDDTVFPNASRRIAKRPAVRKSGIRRSRG